jgi:integrase
VCRLGIIGRFDRGVTRPGCCDISTIQQAQEPQVLDVRGQESGKRRKVAEYNPSPRWPQGYFQVLEEMGVEERRRGFYAHWVRQFVGFHHGRRPSEMGGPKIHAFLSHLAINRHVAASTQNQARNAIEFRYQKVIKKELEDFGDFARARLPKRLPVVLSRQEVHDVRRRMDGIEGMIARLMYGTGMRVNEALGLRIQDLSFDRNEITVHGKGNPTSPRLRRAGKVRRVPFPAKLQESVRKHLVERKKLFESDREQNVHEVYLPDALARKYPKAPYEWRWQFVFPSDSYSADPRSGCRRRHHLHEIRMQRAVKRHAARHAPLLCDTSAGGGGRYSYRAGTAGP